jgi:drug/metabolite transporter (DMT)-like permease
LAGLAFWEAHRYGRRLPAERLGAALAGAFLGTDLVLWTHAIYDVGAGVATVLGNLQVLFVAIVAWLTFGERPQPRFLLALPVVMAGVVLVAGLLGHPRFGGHPVAGALYGVGTSVTYAAFIVLLRGSSGRTPHVATPLAEATLGATLSSLALGLALGQMSLRIRLSSLGWLALLAMVSQTVGWLFITSALPHLPAALSSLLLLFQPAATTVLAVVVLSQRPTLLQVVGGLLVCGGALWAASAQRGAMAGPEPPPG